MKGDDPWGDAANIHLLAMLRKLYGRGRSVPGRPASYFALKRGRSDAGAGFTQNVMALVGAKNAWAAAMREAEFAGETASSERQRELWDNLMKTAAAGFVEGE